MSSLDWTPKLISTFHYLVKGTFGEQSGNTSTNEGRTDKTEDPSSNAGLIVIVVVIFILIAAALLLVGLHFKRKLPESFYNLGGLIKGDKQWKPVLAKVINNWYIIDEKHTSLPSFKWSMFSWKALLLIAILLLHFNEILCIHKTKSCF